MSLQAQLAAINGTAGKHPGAVFASSKRHEDALGRGIHYSVNQGHVLRNRNIGYQASILEASAKDAADIPMRVLKENFRDAIQALSDIHAPILEFLDVCNDDEPADATTIHHLMVAIGSLVGDAVESCLHVLEYLVRRYSLHVHHMEDLLWALVPHHDVLPALLHRALQLVDLQSNQSYLWMRPYTDPQHMVVVPRALIAANVLKRPDLVTKCGQWTQQVARLAADTNTTRTGISRVLSFAAAVLVEGLAWQAQAHRLPEHLEATTRALLPSILHACSRNSPSPTKNLEWRGWGHILASVLAETTDLALPTMDALGMAIVQGATSNDDDNTDDWDNTDALVALLAVLLPPQQQIHEPSNYLPLVNDKLLGCDLSPRVATALSKAFANLPALLGHLVVAQKVTVAPLLATLVVQNTANANNNNNNNNQALLVDLVQEKSLRSVWKHERLELVASCAAHLVQTAIHKSEHDDDDDDDAMSDDDEEESVALTSGNQEFLQALHSLDADACERGIAFALKSQGNNIVEGLSQELKALLDGVVPLDSMDDDQNNERTRASLLPPRVALEHADAAVRRSAIERLVAKELQGDDLEHASSVTQSLVRRWSVDDDPEIATVAATHALEAFEKNIVAVSDDAFDSWAELCLAGLDQWGEEDSAQTLNVGMSIAGHVAQANVDPMSPLYKTLILTMASYLGGQESCNAAAKALHLALGNAAAPKKAADSVKAAFKIVVGADDLFQAALEIDNVSGSTITTYVRRRLLWSWLQYFKSVAAQVKKSVSLAQQCLQVCFAVLQFPSIQQQDDAVSEAQADLIVKCFSTGMQGTASVRTRQDVSELLQALSAAPSDHLFESVATPAIEFLVKLDESFTHSPLLLEASVESSNEQSRSRLAALYAKHLADGSVEKPWLAMIPALALLEQPDQALRRLSLKIIKTLTPILEKCKQPWKNLGAVCKVFSAAESTSSMENRTILSSLLAEVQTEDGHGADSAANTLLKLVVHCAVGPSEDSPTLSPGSCFCASVLLRAMEGAGEACYPLMSRWELAGLPLFKAFSRETVETFSDHHQSLAESVVTMLKGVTVKNSTGIIISSGPRSGGGRSRSYSVSQNDGVFVNPYPSDMAEALITIFQMDSSITSRTFARLASEFVLTSPSWGEGVYCNLSKSLRSKIGKATLLHYGGENSEISQSNYLQFPFDAQDIKNLLSDHENVGIGTTILLTDFIRARASQLKASNGATALVTSLFSLFDSLQENEQGFDFCVRAIYLALCDLFRQEDGSSLSVKSGSVTKKWAKGLAKNFIKLVDGRRISHRTRSSMLELLILMCEQHSTNTLDALHSVVIFAVSFASTDFLESSEIFARSLPPLFGLSCLSNQRIAALFAELSNASESLDKKTRCGVFQVIAKSLAAKGPLSKEIHQSASGAFVAVVIASDGNCSSVEGVLECLPTGAQTKSLLLLLEYCRSAVVKCANQEASSQTHKELPSLDEIFEGQQLNDEALPVFVFNIMKIVRNMLLLETMHRFVQRSQGVEATVCLQMWQELLVVQSLAQVNNQGEDQSWSSAATAVHENREYLQALLPAHIFVAAISSLILEGDSDEIRTSALRLLVDRLSDLDPYGDDTILFWDLMPVVVGLLKGSEADDSQNVSIRQAALVAVEHMARVLSLGVKLEQKANLFLSALGRATDLLKRPCQKLSEGGNALSSIDRTSWQMISSVGLCASTLIRVTGVKCISSLPKLLKRVSISLSAANKLICNEESEKPDDVLQARLMQTACLRALTAATESVPQSLPSHLRTLLTESGALSLSLRKGANMQTTTSVRKFDEALAAGVPARVLLPVLGDAVGNIKSSEALFAVLFLLHSVTEQSNGVELIAQKSTILGIVTRAFEFKCDTTSSTKQELIKRACMGFVGLVMKLSEVQLRSIFASLREWRGDFDALNPDHDAYKRYAFWTVCTLLSRELNIIFLPCLSSIVVDAVNELEFIVNQLTTTVPTMSSKKRKLESNVVKSSLCEDSMRTLQPLLNCLEQSLRSDANDGGRWVRTDVKVRYHAILEPLGKLFFAKFPSNYPLPESSDNAYSVVVSSPGDGNVISCLTALANAGGSEELWKPLNHHVLEACGHEKRTIVRKAGLECLVRLIQSLGEEYMVLLPECLPVLSELLEDSDEDISGLARKCIGMAEDLLGESLEDSLR